MALLQKIKNLCLEEASHGFLPLESYMSLCLDHYYTQKQPLGPLGDFITAPEISQLFGELLGLWFLEQYQKLGSPRKFYLVELGPGRGTLMADFLRFLPSSFIEAMQLYFIDINPYLRSSQERAIAPFKAVWLKSFRDFIASTSNQPLPIFLVANEFFDALPTRQFKVKNSTWHEAGIIYNKKEQQLEISYKASNPPPLYAPPLQEGLIWEYSPKSLSIIKDIVLYIEKNKGSALIIDYGDDGYGNTLQAVKDHKKVSPLSSCGDIDITTHVNFTALKKSLSKSSISIFGPKDQGIFLKNIGIYTRAQNLTRIAKTAEERSSLFSGLYRLTAPSQMGKLFKVLALVDTNRKGKISGF